MEVSIYGVNPLAPMRRQIQLLEQCIGRQRQEPDPPFDSPSLVVPFQNSHLLQDDAKVARALGVVRVRVWLGVYGSSQAGFLSTAVELLDIVGKRKPVTAELLVKLGQYGDDFGQLVAVLKAVGIPDSQRVAVGSPFEIPLSAAVRC